MNLMISQFYQTSKAVLEMDDRAVVLMAASGAFLFPDLKRKYPQKFVEAVDVGIMEQSMVSIAAGMSIAGMIPIIYGQSPFIIERAYEQIKVDFGYQQLGGNFVGFGASTENAIYGATHCCPADLAVLGMIPGMEIVVPGRPDEYHTLFLEAYADNHPTYYRITRYCNSYNKPVMFGKANIVKKGCKATVLAVGPMLELAMQAFKDEDVTIFYYTTIVPFDEKTLQANLVNDRLLVMEPAYQGGMLPQIAKALHGNMMKMDLVGYPLEFITNHGYVADNASRYGLTVEQVKSRYQELIK